MHEKIIILDFGSQTTQLIGRRIRELNTYCEILPYHSFPADDPTVRGVILSGSPYSVNNPDAFRIDTAALRGRYPVLGICYGAQLMAHLCGGRVETAPTSEYGRTEVEIVDTSSPLFQGIPQTNVCWMSHTDYISGLPHGFHVTARTPVCPIAAMENPAERLYAVQFHPEVMHTEHGTEMLRSFVYDVCGCTGTWRMDSFVQKTIEELRQQIGGGRALCALSGGVDSSVAAVLLSKAIGSQLTCVFVDHGLLRKNEGDEVEAVFGRGGTYDVNFVRINARDRFYARLKGVTEPEQKRKIIGKGFIDVFDAEAHKITDARWLAQGTIYPDRIESLNITGKVIKSHHNVGGLPEKMHLRLCEPLQWLFKDEVRRVGRQLGMPEHLITRHPFPGPGLAVRILGDITREKVQVLQEADDIFIRGLREWSTEIDGKQVSLYDQIWQAGVVLLPIKSVGVMGDERTYEKAVALRAVTSQDAMTADWAHLPYEFMAQVSNDIINKVKGINRVCYDISSKPPSTIEWE